MRTISAPMLASLTSGQVMPAFLVNITFRSGSAFVWSGVGDLVYGGNTYKGVGTLGKIGSIGEGVEVNADGTSITLSGIDPILLADCLTDIQIGAPVTIFFVLLDGHFNILGTPYPLFVGTVDQPTIQIGLAEITISLKLENRLVNLQRPNLRRYTAADQRHYYPNDTAFNTVEILNDAAFRWGS